MTNLSNFSANDTVHGGAQKLGAQSRAH